MGIASLTRMDVTTVDDQKHSAELVVPWNERGLVVIHLEVDFIHEATPEFWTTLADRFGFVKSPFGESGQVSAASFSTRVDEGPTITTLKGYIHPFAKEPQIGHVTLSLKRSPKKQHDDRVEGKSSELYAALERIAGNWIGERSIKCDTTVAYLVDSSRWKSRLVLPKGRKVEVSGRTVVLHPQSESWLLDEGQVPPLRRVSINVSGRRDPFIITGEGEQELKFDHNIMQTVDEGIWQALANFLRSSSNA